MSGVNGGIDYDIDLTTLPAPLAARIRYIQQGPDSPTALIEAAEEIAIQAPQHPQTLPVLVDMLGFNNPAAANIAIDALAVAGRDSIPSLLTGVAAFNYSVNAYALRALALIGNPSVADVCLACARKGPIPNVRRAACRALAALKYDDQAQAEEAYKCAILLADAEPDWSVRYAAIVALQKFVAVHLLSADLLEDALLVVKSASKGKNLVSSIGRIENADEGEAHKRETEIKTDPTVVARAHVAHRVMAVRMKELQSV